MSNVHSQPKLCEVVVDQLHSLLQVLSRAKWEGAVINLKALQYLICGELFRFEHCWCMTAYFSIGKVLVSSRHDTEDWNVHLLPYKSAKAVMRNRKRTSAMLSP
jgi:hypothetical protein